MKMKNVIRKRARTDHGFKKTPEYAEWLGSYRKSAKHHFKKRCLERLNLQLTDEDVESIIVSVRDGTSNVCKIHGSINVSIDYERRKWYMISFGKVKFWMLYSITYKTPVTSLTPDQTPHEKLEEDPEEVQS